LIACTGKLDGNGSRDEIELSLDTNSITGVGHRVQNSSQVYRTFGLGIVLRGISPLMMMGGWSWLLAFVYFWCQPFITRWLLYIRPCLT